MTEKVEVTENPKWVKKLEALIESDYGKILIGLLLSIVTVFILFFCALNIGGSKAISILFGLFGGILGWILGIYLSPKSPEEKNDFSDYGKGISAFAGGFLVAKMDLLFNESLVSGNVYSDAYVGRFLLFGVSFCIGVLATFYGRRYIARSSSGKGDS